MIAKQKLKFLLLDDDPTFNFIHKKKIARFGLDAEIVDFVSPLKVLIHLMDLSDDDIPDIILLDINMPELNGFEFLEELKAKRPNLLNKLSVFIVTSSLNPEDYQIAKQFDCIKGYHNKPIDLDNIMTSVNWLLKERPRR